MGEFSMTREQIIEAMARAACDFDLNRMQGINRENFVLEFFGDYKNTSGAALSAIEALGYVVVPIERIDALDRAFIAGIDRLERAAMAYERLGKLTKDGKKEREMRKAVMVEIAEARRAIIEAGKV